MKIIVSNLKRPVSKLASSMYCTKAPGEYKRVLEVLQQKLDSDNQEYLLKNKSLVNKVDNSSSLDERSFHTDCLARVLSFQDPCTAVFVKDSSILISFNAPKGARLAVNLNNDPQLRQKLSTRIDVLCKDFGKLLTQTETKYDLISNTLKHSTSYNVHLSIITQEIPKLLYGGDEEDILVKRIQKFRDCLKPYKLHFNQPNFIKEIGYLDFILKNEPSDDLLNSYFYLLDYAVEYPNSQIRGKLLENLLPMLSDSLKANLFCSSVKNSLELNVINNENYLHCETNMALTVDIKENDYLGISRLCCFYCEIILSTKKINHSGHHGLLFPYNVDYVLEQDTMLQEALIRYIKDLVSNDRKDIFDHYFDIKDKDNIIENFIKLNFKEVINKPNNFLLNKKEDQNANYLLSKNKNITGFHPEYPEKYFSSYCDVLYPDIPLSGDHDPTSFPE